jgi:hypothetical protein
MGKTLRNSGYVALGAGVIIILASYAGYVMLEGVDRFEAHLKLSDFRTYIALVPGIVMTSLGWVIVRYQRLGLMQTQK